MFRTKSMLLSFVFLLGITVCAWAQPSLTRNDIPTAIGTAYTTIDGMDTYTVNVGSGGSNQTWDFSNLDLGATESYTSVIVDVNSTGFANEFPDANLAITQEFEDDEMDIEGYGFAEITNDHLLFLGAAYSDADTTIIFDFQENTPEFNFPVNYNDSWTVSRVFGFEIEMDMGGQIITITVEINDDDDVVYDGWGTVILPNGDSYSNSMRFQRMSTSISTTIIPGLPPQTETSTYISYEWYHSGVFGPLLTIESMEGETNPNFTMAEIVSYYEGEPIGVEDDGIVGDLRTRLLPNYPNPFNPSTTVQFQLATPSTVSLDIYNSTGQLVRTLTEQRYGAGLHTVQWDGLNDEGQAVSSGTYFYQLRTPESLQTRKMTLLK